MKRSVLAVLVLSGLVSLGAEVPAWAHHAFAAAYDMSQPVTVHGVITQVRLENPHSWFFLDVRDASGKVDNWAFEAGTPSGMIRNGFKPGAIKAGSEVTIKGFRAKVAAQKMGMLRRACDRRWAGVRNVRAPAGPDASDHRTEKPRCAGRVSSMKRLVVGSVVTVQSHWRRCGSRRPRSTSRLNKRRRRWNQDSSVPAPPVPSRAWRMAVGSVRGLVAG